jgi:hypothetical protein
MVISAALALALVGGNFVAPIPLAACPMSGSAQTISRQCCCGANCQCGPSCGVKKSDRQGKNESNPTQFIVRDQAKVNAVVGSTAIAPAEGGGYGRNESVTWDCRQPAPTLLAQHTLLRV